MQRWPWIGPLPGQSCQHKAAQEFREGAHHPEPTWAELKSHSAAVSRNAEVCYPFGGKRGKP
jgi:hypothetical protein